MCEVTTSAFSEGLLHYVFFSLFSAVFSPAHAFIVLSRAALCIRWAFAAKCISVRVCLLFGEGLACCHLCGHECLYECICFGGVLCLSSFAYFQLAIIRGQMYLCVFVCVFAGSLPFFIFAGQAAEAGMRGHIHTK